MHPAHTVTRRNAEASCRREHKSAIQSVTHSIQAEAGRDASCGAVHELSWWSHPQIGVILAPRDGPGAGRVRPLARVSTAMVLPRAGPRNPSCYWYRKRRVRLG